MLDVLLIYISDSHRVCLAKIQNAISEIERRHYNRNVHHLYLCGNSDDNKTFYIYLRA